MKIEKKIAPPKYYGDKRSLEDIIYIVVQTINNGTVTHYHINNGQAFQIIPDNYMSDAVNGPRFHKRGYLHGICNKYNCISIGITENMSEEDIKTCINLIMTIKQRYKINNDCVIRQMDVTGETNPIIWHDNEKWIKDIKNNLIEL